MKQFKTLSSTILTALIIVACGGSSTGNIQQTQVETPAENTTENTTDSGTDTGSTSAELLAQAEHPRYYRYKSSTTPQYTPVVIQLLGDTSEKTISITTGEPPEDVTPCNKAVIVSYFKIPTPPTQYQYNSWWLLASNTVTTNYTEDKKVYFYWAKELSDTEVGLVPISETSTITSPENLKIDTGFSTLPYQWVSKLEGFNVVPVNPEEPCEK